MRRLPVRLQIVYWYVIFLAHERGSNMNYARLMLVEIGE